MRRTFGHEDEDDGPAIVQPEELGLPSEFGAKPRDTRESERAQLAADIAEAARRTEGAVVRTADKDDGNRDEEDESEGERDSEDDEEEGEKGEEEEDEAVKELPISHEAVLRGHERAVSALALEPSGARLLTGSLDYTVKLWDFGGMDSRLQSFRSIEPSEGCPVNQLAFSPSTGATGVAMFVAATGSSQPRLYDRDARQIAAFIRGDQYISDQSNTKGHTQGITACSWNPRDASQIMTASLDGTVRLWNPETLSKQHRTVIKARAIGRQRASVSAAAWDCSGTLIAAAVPLDGSVQMWKAQTGPFHRPHIVLESAHAAGTETSSLAFFKDGNGLVTRGGDDTMKLWDIRNTREPVVTWDDLPNGFSHTDLAISPDEEFIVTGTSFVPAGRGRATPRPGTLAFFKRDTMSLAKTVGGFGETSVLRVVWNERTRQIVVGLHDGTARVLYDPERSTKGALLCVSRQPPRVDTFKADMAPMIFVPMEHTDMMKKEIPIAKQLRMAKRQEKREKYKHSKNAVAPPPPAPGTGGSLGSCSTQYLLRQMGVVKPEVEEDPREALIRLDKKAKEKAFWFKKYDETQPAQQHQQQQPTDEPPPQKRQEH